MFLAQTVIYQESTFKVHSNHALSLRRRSYERMEHVRSISTSIESYRNANRDRAKIALRSARVDQLSLRKSTELRQNRVEISKKEFAERERCVRKDRSTVMVRLPFV